MIALRWSRPERVIVAHHHALHHRPMTNQIRFDDGARYERYMGVWSHAAGVAFLHWLRPPAGLRWLDVGCGSGAFTELLATHCAPAALSGIDPSVEQLAYARTRPVLRDTDLQQAAALALPYADHAFDAAVMPLVIFFVPEPARGIAEMARVVAPGGLVTAYTWDMHGGGFPYHVLQREMRALGAVVPAPPSVEASRPDIMEALWRDAGLIDVNSHEITIQRTFADFDDYWDTVQGGASVGRSLTAMSREATAQLQDRLREALPADAGGRITYTARANAISGRVSHS